MLRAFPQPPSHDQPLPHVATQLGGGGPTGLPIRTAHIYVPSVAPRAKGTIKGALAEFVFHTGLQVALQKESIRPGVLDSISSVFPAEGSPASTAARNSRSCE